MIVKERNLDGEIIEREIETVDELRKRISELNKENYELRLTLDLVTAKELKAVDTLDLLEELYYRVQGLEKMEKNHLKLLKKHERASRIIGELKRSDLNQD